MAVTLNTTTSISDYFKSKGLASDYGTRETVYKNIGLEDRLGSYTGSVTQNPAFIKALGGYSDEQLKQALTGKVTLTAAAPTTPAPSTTTPTSFTNAQTAEGTDVYIGNPALNPQFSYPTPSSASSATSVAGSSGISASDALASIPGMPSTDEILGQVFASPGFQNFQQRQQLGSEFLSADAAREKQKLEQSSATKTQEFINSMGRKGLFFSGDTQSGIAQLAESLAASKLDVDRGLAKDLIEKDFDTRDRIYSDVEKIVKDAQAGRKEALDALNDVGLTVIGGKVVPTLAAQREERLIEAEDRVAAYQQANFELQQAKFEVSQAKSEQQMEIAIARLELAQERAENSKDELSVAEKRAEAVVSLNRNGLINYLKGGATPEEAAAAVAKDIVDGPTYEEIDVLGQQALLVEAQRLLGSGEVKVQTPEEVEEEVSQSFYSNLFGVTVSPNLQKEK